MKKQPLTTVRTSPSKTIFKHKIEADNLQRSGYAREEALGSHLVSHGTIKCIVAYAETSETRWRRPWFCTLNACSLVYPDL